jgi:polysaccharide deacetylase 2 family uncharacterized protein YibQ
MASRPAPKKIGASSRGGGKNRGSANRYRKKSGKTGSGKLNPSSWRGATSVHLAVLAAAVVAVVMLIGLIYWGKSSRPTVSTQPAASKRTQGPVAEKVFDHKEPPPAKDAGQPKAAERARSQSETPLDKKPGAEPQGPAKPAQARHSNPQDTHPGPQYAALTPEHNPVETPKPPAPPQPVVPPLTPPVARVAIVIDDFGPDRNIAEKFLDLPIPITFSVLPFQRNSQEIADLAHARQRQVILHLPMEPQGYPKVNPGKGALLVSMSSDTILKSIDTALNATPHITGMNNHMGSHFTENAVLMKTVLEEARKRGLYFIDSYTSPRSAAASVAQQIHIPFLRRDVFLDNNRSESAVRSQIGLLIRRAKIEGTALAIGHPHETTLLALSRAVKEFEREKISVVPAGDLMPAY